MKNLFMYFYNNFSYIFTSIKNSDLSDTVEILKLNCTIRRQGNRRLLECHGVLTDSDGCLLTLSEQDIPTYVVYNQLLMEYDGKYYCGWFRIDTTGRTGVYWYSPSGSYANIGNTQKVYGQVEWYVVSE